jgi:hypothetical protein
MHQIVELREDSQHHPMGRDCELLKKNGDMVMWKNETETGYVVRFEQSPFDQHLFVVDGHHEIGSGKLRDDVEPGIYPYAILHATSVIKAAMETEMAADPNVIVR